VAKKRVHKMRSEIVWRKLPKGGSAVDLGSLCVRTGLRKSEVMSAVYDLARRGLARFVFGGGWVQRVVLTGTETEPLGFSAEAKVELFPHRGQEG